MAQTDVDVCNLAIGRVGGEPIETLTEDSPLGEYCKTAYPAKRDWLLGLHRWVFAGQVGQLARRATTPADCPLSYAYDNPSDLVGAVHDYRTAVDLDAARARVQQVNGYVAAADPAVWIEYTGRIPEARWPTWFNELVVVAFAADLALKVQNRGLAKDLKDAAVGVAFDQGEEGGLLLLAKQADGRNAPQRTLAGWDAGELANVRSSSTLPFRRPTDGRYESY